MLHSTKISDFSPISAEKPPRSAKLPAPSSPPIPELFPPLSPVAWVSAKKLSLPVTQAACLSPGKLETCSFFITQKQPHRGSRWGCFVIWAWVFAYLLSRQRRSRLQSRKSPCRTYCSPSLRQGSGWYCSNGRSRRCRPLRRHCWCCTAGYGQAIPH